MHGSLQLLAKVVGGIFGLSNTCLALENHHILKVLMCKAILGS